MILKFLVLNTIRKTPNKILILFFAWMIIGVFYNRFKILKSFYEFGIKENSNKRKFIFELANRHSNKI